MTLVCAMYVETENWRDELFERRFTSIDTEIGIRQIFSYGIKDICPRSVPKNTKRNEKVWLGKTMTKKAMNREKIDVVCKI